MAYLTNTSVNGDLGVSGLVSVGSAGLKFTSGIINIFGSSNSGGTGGNSISIGSHAAATGNFSVAMGYSASASLSSIALGQYASASGGVSIAIGSWNNSDSKTTASGLRSIAIGSCNATASGNYSVAIGDGAKATGNTGIAIGSDAKASTGTSIGYAGAAGTAIYLGWDGGKKYVSCSASASSWSFSSDINDKTDIEPIEHALDFINAVEPITYVDNSRSLYTEDQDMLFKSFNEEEHSKGTKKGDRRHAGVKAQQVYSELKEKYKSDNYASIVSYNKYNEPDSDEYEQYRVAYTEFIPFLIRSTQELSAIVDEQKKLIEDLQSQLNELKK